MADISFYKYLEAAFRHKLFKDTKATSFNFLGFNLPYETIEGKKGIFEYARRVLPSFYSLHFADTEEGHLQMAKDFLQKLDRHQDPELPKYFDPNQAPAEYAGTIAEAQQQSQAEGRGIPAQGAGGGMPGLPAGPSISPARRRIYRIPPTPEKPKPDIAIASETGAIREAGDASKLVKASSSGAVVEKPPSKIFIADKGGVREHVIKPSGRFKFPSAFSNFGKNIGSKMGVFIKRNLTPMRLGTLVSGGIGAVAGSAFGPMGTLTGGIGGGLMPSWLSSGGGRKFFGKLGNGAVNATARLTNPALRMSIPAPAKKWVLLFFGGFVLLTIGVGFIAAPPNQPGSTQPPPAVYPPYQPGAGSGVIACPLNSGRIRTGSKDKGGHCSPGYQTDYPCASPDTTGRATAVDIQSQDKIVYLPKLNNADVEWTITQIDTNTDYVANGQFINGGYSVRASAESQGKKYLIRFVHIESTSLTVGQTPPPTSGTAVGKYRDWENHVHITIEEDNVFKPGDIYFNLCQ